jgi:hypothetical protein
MVPGFTQYWPFLEPNSGTTENSTISEREDLERQRKQNYSLFYKQNKML